ncbi:hypothetical protein JCM8547_006294 [Rhodosporidiobolus lusitaniae]
MPEFELIYHAGIPGRGEFVRLLFEATGTPYKDSALEEGQDAVGPYSDGSFKDSDKNPLPFAPPVLRHGEVVISQTPNLLLYLATHLTTSIDLDAKPKGGQEPASKKSKTSPSSVDDPATFHAHALALTALDATNEIHDLHHPIAVMEYYEDQKDVAERKAPYFRKDRVPKFFQHFEDNLKRSSSGFLLENASYADLVLFQTIDGYKFALPNLLARIMPEYPKLEAHYQRVRSAPRIKSYLESDRRQKYSMGMFRHYPELDEEKK